MYMIEEAKEILKNTKSGISSISQGSQSISYDSTVQAFRVNESVKALLPKPSIRLLWRILTWYFLQMMNYIK